jgi:hypothetical protein
LSPLSLLWEALEPIPLRLCLPSLHWNYPSWVNSDLYLIKLFDSHLTYQFLTLSMKYFLYLIFKEPCCNNNLNIKNLVI